MSSNEPPSLPGKWMTTEQGSFAQFTTERRLPGIAASLAKQYPMLARPLERLGEDVVQSAQIDTSLLSGSEWWQRRSEEAKRTRWRDWPFFDLEFMFYAALVAIFEGCDPFARTKDNASCEALNQLALRMAAPHEEIHVCVWDSVFENQNDLSQIEQVVHARDDDRILLDQMPRDFSTASKMAIVLDNVGWELLADLRLADRLLEQPANPCLTLYCKSQAMFVSDATRRDIRTLLDAMEVSSSEAISSLARRLRLAARNGRLLIRDQTFWSEARHFTELETSLALELESCDIVICKGDLNYRRFVEDRKWPYTSDAAQVTQNVTFSGLALRTVKSEVLVGAPASMREKLTAMSVAQFTDGRMALAQRLGQNSTQTKP